MARLRVLGFVVVLSEICPYVMASDTCLLPLLTKVEAVLHNLIESAELKHCGHYSQQVHRMTKELMVDGASY